MDGLLQSAEAIALRVGSLTAGLIVSDKLDLDKIILGDNRGGSVEEAIKMTSYLVAVEYGADALMEKLVGYRAPSLHKDVGVNFLVSFATNVAVYYVLQQAEVVKMINEKFGRSDVQMSMAHAVVYALTQELAYRAVSMVWSSKDPNRYGQKYQP